MLFRFIAYLLTYILSMIICVMFVKLVTKIVEKKQMIDRKRNDHTYICKRKRKNKGDPAK